MVGFLAPTHTAGTSSKYIICLLFLVVKRRFTLILGAITGPSRGFYLSNNQNYTPNHNEKQNYFFKNTFSIYIFSKDVGKKSVEQNCIYQNKKCLEGGDALY